VVGQSGTDNPDSVLLTNPPIKMRIKVHIVVNNDHEYNIELYFPEYEDIKNGARNLTPLTIFIKN